VNWFWLSWALAGAGFVFGLIALVVSIRAKGVGWLWLSLVAIFGSLVFTYFGWVNWAPETRDRFLAALDKGDYGAVNDMLASDDWSRLPNGALLVKAEDGTSAVVLAERLPLVIKGSSPVSARKGISHALVSRSDFVVGPGTQESTNLEIEIFCTTEGGTVRCRTVAVWELLDEGIP